MSDSCTLENCSDHDVLLFGSTTLKTEQLRSEVSRHFSKPKLGEQITGSLRANKNVSDIYSLGKYINGKEPHGTYEQWFIDGVDCEILKPGAAIWQKGRVKIKLNVSLEFCPDEPEVEKNSAVTMSNTKRDYESLVFRLEQLSQNQLVMAEYMAQMKCQLDDISEQVNNQPELQQNTSLQDALNQLEQQFDELKAPSEVAVKVVKLLPKMAAEVDEIQPQPTKCNRLKFS